MAKSLRSKSKRAFRKVKRENPKSDYNIRDKIRTQRLSEKLKELKAVENSDDEETVQDGDDAAAAGDMNLDDNAQPSTSEVAAGKKPEGKYTPHNNAIKQAQLFWILGLLDQDRLTFCHHNDSPPSNPSSASVMKLLQSLSTAC